MPSKAKTVAEYLAELPADRRAALEAVRKAILKNLDKNYEEGMQYGMIGYYVPHKIYPAGYHCDPKQPLPFVCLASQKTCMSLHLCCMYGDSTQLKWFQKAWADAGKKLDMGKACVRFKKLEDVPLEVVGEAIRRIPAKEFIKTYESLIESSPKRPVKKKSAKPKKASGSTKSKARKK
jgi:hypothetical protein